MLQSEKSVWEKDAVMWEESGEDLASLAAFASSEMEADRLDSSASLGLSGVLQLLGEHEAQYRQPIHSSVLI